MKVGIIDAGSGGVAVGTGVLDGRRR